MIEVLAAMVIFAGSAVVLFSWIGQTADRLSRLSNETTTLFAELAAIEYLRGLNPSQTPSGNARVGDAVVEWKSAPVGSAAPALAPGGGPGLYVVQLYQVQMDVRPDGGAPAGRRTLMLAGWVQTREARNDNPFVSTTPN
jgi:general secretion pathway protein I